MAGQLLWNREVLQAIRHRRRNSSSQKNPRAMARIPKESRCFRPDGCGEPSSKEVQQGVQEEMTTYRCLLVYVPSDEETIEKSKKFLWQEADALIKDMGDCEGSAQPSGRASADEPLIIPGKTPSEAAQEEPQKGISDMSIYGITFLPQCPIHHSSVLVHAISFGPGSAFITVECLEGKHHFNVNYDLESIDGLIKK